MSNVEEGVILRERGINTRILVMADFLPDERAGLLDYELTPVIHSLEDLPEWGNRKTDDALFRVLLEADKNHHILTLATPGAEGARMSLLTALEIFSLVIL